MKLRNILVVPAILSVVTTLTMSAHARAGTQTPTPNLGRFDPGPIEVAER